MRKDQFQASLLDHLLPVSRRLPSVCVSVFKYPLFIRTVVTVDKAHPNDPILINCVCKDCILNQVMF